MPTGNPIPVEGGAPAGRRRPEHSLTLERGLRLLRLLANHPEGLGVTELAGGLGTHRAGVYRLLGPLLAHRLVTRSADRRYTLGHGVLELASAVRSQLQEIALRELRKLADEVGATTALTLRDGDDAVVAAVVEPAGAGMRLAYRPGLRHPIDRSAPGLAILAGGPPRPGERAEVAHARERGWAISSGELLPGATGVAAPIVVPGRDVEASISAVWLAPRDPAATAQAVVRSARAIAAPL
jgi:DNA-binding IclR family transcriptional regulator